MQSLSGQINEDIFQVSLFYFLFFRKATPGNYFHFILIDVIEVNKIDIKAGSLHVARFVLDPSDA